jgi:TetR/AcrR family tetracycline transcriptional repressor
VFTIHQDSRRARKQLDRPTIVKTALALMDEVGVDGLTMRRLAEQLGVTAGSLYRHVRDKDELVVLLADEIAGEVPPISTTVAWQQALADMAMANRRALLAHRDAARLLAGVPPVGPRRLQHIETILQVMLAAGFGGRTAAWGAYHFNNLVTEFVADEVRLAEAAAAAGTTRGQLLADGRAQLRALPADQFPSLVQLADEVASDQADAIFEFGLRLCLRGLEALLDEVSPR